MGNDVMPILYYGISGQLQQKLDEYISRAGEPLLVIEKDEVVESYKNNLLFEKYEVVTLEDAISRYPNPEIWVTYRKADRTSRMIAKSVNPYNIHFFEADLEYRLGCGFLGHFISYRMNNFSPCCIVSHYPVVKASGSLEKRLEQWKDFETGLISNIRENKPNPCSNCPHLRYDFWHNTIKLNNITFGTCQPGDVCNYKCVYCFAESALNNPKAITDGFTTYELIKQLSFIPEYDNSNMIVSIANGEFCANRDCDYVLDILFKKKWKVSLLTNGSIYKEKLKEYLKTGKVIKFQTSLDAGTPESYKRVKGLDAFDRVIENLKRYEVKNYDFFTLKYIFLESYNDTEADVDGFINAATEVGCRHITISSDLFKPFTPKMRKLVERMIKKASENDIMIEKNISYVSKKDVAYIFELIEKYYKL